MVHGITVSFLDSLTYGFVAVTETFLLVTCTPRLLWGVVFIFTSISFFDWHGNECFWFLIVIFSWLRSNRHFNWLLPDETLQIDCCRSNRLDSYCSTWFNTWSAATLHGVVSVTSYLYKMTIEKRTYLNITLCNVVGAM